VDFESCKTVDNGRRHEKVISGVSKKTDTKEGIQFRVIMEHEEKIFFCFRPFVIAQELLEVTTKLPVKLNDPVINVGT
jgi:hypothetical protein